MGSQSLRLPSSLGKNHKNLQNTSVEPEASNSGKAEHIKLRKEAPGNCPGGTRESTISDLETGLKLGEVISFCAV